MDPIRATNESEPATGAFRRYLALLEGLAGMRSNASIRDIAARSGLAPATTYRLLAELKALGVVYENPSTGQYGLSSRLWQLVERFEPRDQLRTVALPFMQELRDITQETVTLVTASGRERTSILQVLSRLHGHFGAVIGVPERLDTGIPGKILLAFQPEPARRSYIEWITSLEGPEAGDRLAATIETVRKDGYVIGRAERLPDFVAVGVPVYGQSGVIAALDVVGPASRFTTERAWEALPAVRKTAEAIGNALTA
jgi:DNA-binding IclR family transcriptional regulator